LLVAATGVFGGRGEFGNRRPRRRLLGLEAALRRRAFGGLARRGFGVDGFVCRRIARRSG